MKYTFNIKAKVSQTVAFEAKNEKEAKKIMNNYFRKYGFAKYAEFITEESELKEDTLVLNEQNILSEPCHITLSTEDSAYYSRTKRRRKND